MNLSMECVTGIRGRDIQMGKTETTSGVSNNSRWCQNIIELLETPLVVNWGIIENPNT